MATVQSDRTIAHVKDEYLGETHRYTPHRASLPPLRVYLRELWRRRQFAHELARAALKAQNYGTAFGQVWLIFNPLLNAFVYFILVDIIRRGSHPPNFFPHLLGGIFAYSFVSGTISQCAGSVLGGGRLILNTAFPRLLLPMTQVAIAFFRFLPTVPILIAALLLTHTPITPATLMAIPVFLLMVLFAAGVGFIAATLQVYFRDFSQLLPYLLRIGLYMTPILYFYETASPRMQRFLDLNPLTPLFVSWSDALVLGTMPSPRMLAVSAVTSVVLFVVGALIYMSREASFAVRL
jgi:teichoic acid transport system permease protein